MNESEQAVQKYSASGDALSRAELGVASSSSSHTNTNNSNDLVAAVTGLQHEVVKLLDQWTTLTTRLASTTAPRAVAARYHEVAAEWRADFDRATATFHRARERRELFGNNNNNSNNNNTGSGEDLASMHLRRERNTIHQSLTGVGAVLGQAEAVRSDLHSQGRSLRQTSSTVVGIMTSSIPGMHSLMESIRRRRSSDDTVVAAVIAVCICFTLWYVLG